MTVGNIIYAGKCWLLSFPFACKSRVISTPIPHRLTEYHHSSFILLLLLPSIYDSLVWRSVILDEGHRIKNEDSDVSKACLGLRARFKIVLTGDPLICFSSIALLPPHSLAHTDFV